MLQFAWIPIFQYCKAEHNRQAGEDGLSDAVRRPQHCLFGGVDRYLFSSVSVAWTDKSMEVFCCRLLHNIMFHRMLRLEPIVVRSEI